MQQTTNYKLNLIEKNDTFSPDPLNDNMEKVEEALKAEAGARTEAVAAEAAARREANDALDQRLKTFEAHHVAMGRYTAETGLTIQLDFTPKVVFAHTAGSILSSGVLVNEPNAPTQEYGEIISNGFRLRYSDNHNFMNYSGKEYWYIALA